MKSDNDPGGLLTPEAKPSETALYFIYFCFTSNVLRDRQRLDTISCPGLTCLDCCLMEWDLRLWREDLVWISVEACTIMSGCTCHGLKGVDLQITLQIIRQSYPFLKGLVTYFLIIKIYF